jgi:hypothetical protein
MCFVIFVCSVVSFPVHRCESAKRYNFRLFPYLFPASSSETGPGFACATRLLTSTILPDEKRSANSSAIVHRIPTLIGHCPRQREDFYIRFP